MRTCRANALGFDMAHLDSVPIQCRSQGKQMQTLPLKMGKESLLRGGQSRFIAIRDSLYD